MMRLRAILLLLLLTPLTAFAFTGRAISDLRFGLRLPDTYVSGAATDGLDFLMVSSAFRGEVRGQLIRQGVPSGPSFYIGDGSEAKVIWTGSVYLVVYRNDGGIWLARVSRGGGLLDAPRRVLPGTFGGPKLVTNGKRLLIGATTRVDNDTPELRAVLLDLDGYALSSAVTLAYWPGFSSGTYDVAGAGDGFALLMYGYKSTRVVRYDANGVAINREGTLLEPEYDGSAGGYHSFGGVIAGHGDNAVVLFTTAFWNKAFVELKTAVIGPQGEIVQSTTTVRSVPVLHVDLHSLQWDGSAFTAFVSVDHDPTGNYREVHPALLRINADGTLLDDLADLSAEPVRRFAVAVAIGASQTLAAWYESTNQESVGSSYVLVPRAAATPGAPVPVGTTAIAHAKVATNAMGSQQLAAWAENDADGWVLRASRLDANANYLDGAGIVLGRLRTINHWDEYGISIDNDGTNWLVTWADGAAQGARIDAAGRLLDATPFAISYGYDVSVRWTGETYLVVSGSLDLMLASVSRDGIVGSTRMIAAHRGNSTAANPSISWKKPVIVCDTQWCLAGSVRHSYYIPESVMPVFVDETSVTAVPLDHRGGFAGDTFTISEHAGSFAAASSPNATIFRYGTNAVLFPAGTTTGAKVIRTASPGASTMAAAFDGYDFIFADLDVFQKTITTHRVTAAGSLIETRKVTVDNATILQSPSLAVSTDRFPLLAYVTSDASIERRAHAFAVFLPEIDAASVTRPLPPSRPRASRLSSDRILVRWDALAAAPFGYSIEVRVAGSGYRQIAIAPANATEAVVTLGGVEAEAVRLRAWNREGMSDASGDAVIAPGAMRAIRR